MDTLRLLNGEQAAIIHGGVSPSHVGRRKTLLKDSDCRLQNKDIPKWSFRVTVAMRSETNEPRSWQEL